MYAKNATREQLTKTATKLGFSTDPQMNGTKLRFRLKMENGNDEYRKITHQIDGRTRRTSSVCIHGHYRFFKELFEIAPDAIIDSSWMGKIRHTKETLDDNYENMRYKIIRQWDGLSADDECNCTEEMK